ncbi:hypothetical protein A9257_16230 [Vibrio cyclitrophicus]|uniref:hypothetical protein n=1 Tax=Vibrio cyclitrophicus TaxID=47951 RepID=UPI0007EEA4CC|nr:hypothetical protein [Vibrio cyclitrophicus]OBS91867.1 hypothetical protein A9257_16230 [Vibrio cyclitrophicus]
MQLNIIKRNRKYYAAKTARGADCKILIDDHSEELELGDQVLAVEDVSVRSKYGTDLIYKLKASAKEQVGQGITTLRSDYNTILVDRSRALGGSWNKDEKAWIFPSFVSKEVDKLDEIFNSEPVMLEITALEEIRKCKQGIGFIGKPLCKAFGRDSGARINSDIAMISGYATSGGSRNNWTTILNEGTVLRLQMPSKLLLLYQDNRFDVKIIN